MRSTGPEIVEHRRRSEPAPDCPARIWLVLIPAMTLPFIASFLYYVVLSGHVVAKWIYAGTKVFTLIWPLLCYRWILDKKPIRFGCPNLNDIRTVPIGMLVGGIIVGLMFGLMQTPFGDIVRAGAPKIREKTEQLGVLQHYWSFALFLSLVHSLLEEYYWRWFVYGKLRLIVRRSLAYFLAGTSFAAHHIVITTQFFPMFWGILVGSLVGVGGFIWCYFYERQQTLMGIWISHLIVDLGILILGHQLIFGSF